MHFPKNKMRSILLAQFFLMKKSISQFESLGTMNTIYSYIL